MKKLSSIFFILIGLLLIANMPVLAEEAVQGQSAAAAVTTAAPAAPAAQDVKVRLADPSGVSTGNASDITTAVPGSPTTGEIADAVGHNKVSINLMWTLITGFLVMFMQAGFAG